MFVVNLIRDVVKNMRGKFSSMNCTRVFEIPLKKE
jgi:hypothetical protein